MSQPLLAVRVAANIEELRRNLQEGVVNRATAAAVAIQLIGCASMLTSEQQGRATKTIEEGIAAYARLGKDAPTWMRDLSESLKQSATLTDALTVMRLAFTLARPVRVNRPPHFICRRV